LGTGIFTITETAQYLKLSDKTIRKLISSGELKASKVGSSWRVKESEIEKYLNAHTN